MDGAGTGVRVGRWARRGLRSALAGLAGAPAVVALDNAETPWEADTLATEDLLARVAQTPGVALVASLRGAERPSGPSWISTRW